MDTREAIERAAELGMLAGQDYAQACANLNAAREQVFPIPPEFVRGLFHARIDAVVEAWDAHEAHLEDWRTPVIYRCRCPFRGTEAEWKRHLADKLADALAGA